MFRIFCVALLCALFLNLPTSSHAKSLEKELKKSVKYLEKIPEVKWLKISRDNVIVGWKGFPSNFNLINTEAALKGTKATGRTVYV